jgi:hypothetical protein
LEVKKEIMLTLLSLQVRYSMRIPKYENWVQGSKYVVNDINKTLEENMI